MHENNFHGIIHVSATDAHSSFEISQMLADLYSLDKKLITPALLEEIVKTGEQKVLRPHNPILSTEKFNKLFGSKILERTKVEIHKFHSLYAS
jgi:dTDP-4-dehydrorhamnose reductase